MEQDKELRLLAANTERILAELTRNVWHNARQETARRCADIAEAVEDGSGDLGWSAAAELIKDRIRREFGLDAEGGR